VRRLSRENLENRFLIDPEHFIADDGALIFYGELSVDSWYTIRKVETGLDIAPLAQDDAASVFTGFSVVIDALANDSDVDGSLDPASVTIVTPPVHGTAVVDTIAGEITYTHDGSETDVDSLAYTVRDDGGNVSGVAVVRITVELATGVRDPVATRFVLHQNIPNPFNPSTTIAFDVPAGGGHVRLEIFDVRGRLVARLVDGPQSAGHKLVRWDGMDRRGRRASSGVYFCRVTAPGFDETRKMTLVE
jgi:hypothetical protein